jgi:hypothetical protein
MRQAVADTIETDLTSALKTEVEWRHTPDGKPTLAWSLYPIIVGAATSILQCKKLIESWQTGMAERWTDEALHDEFRRSMTETSSVDWRTSTNFMLWSIGLFLESAQHHTAAAVDKTINACRRQR